MNENSKYTAEIRKRITENFIRQIENTEKEALQEASISRFYKSPLQAKIFAGIFRVLLTVFIVIFLLLVTAFIGGESDVDFVTLIIILGPIFVLWNAVKTAKDTGVYLEKNAPKDELLTPHETNKELENKLHVEYQERIKRTLGDQEWFQKYTENDLVHILETNKIKTEELLKKFHRPDTPETELQKLMEETDLAYEEYLDKRAEIVSSELQKYSKDEIEIILDASDSRMGSNDMKNLIDEGKFANHQDIL